MNPECLKNVRFIFRKKSEVMQILEIIFIHSNVIRVTSFYAHMILEMNACWAVFDQHGFELGI